MTVRIAPPSGQRPDSRESGFGALRTSRGNLPLRSVRVHASITGMVAGVEVAQEFTNPYDVALEATYVFPLPDRAAVSSLRMEADGRVVEAVLTERGKARQDYDSAISQGRRAAIAEEERPDVFTMRVGNIVPGEQVTVMLVASQPLPYEDGEITFRFPLVVAPRYIPGCPLPGWPAGTGTAPDTGDVPDASRITPPVLLPGFPNPVRLELTVGIDPAGLRLSDVRSGLHAVTEEAGKDGHTLLRLLPGERLDSDFILRLGVADDQGIGASLALTPDEEGTTASDDETAAFGAGTFTLTLLPPRAAASLASRDVVVVLDRSGSMGGWKMVAARRAAARIIDSLTAADSFAVLCFDNHIERPAGLPDGLAQASDGNRFLAVEFLAGMEARGGTELLPALRRAAELIAVGDRPGRGTADDGGQAAAERVLVLVTDGQVGNEDLILRTIAPQLAGARVHVVGIDQAVNAGFLARLAGIGRGRCELVESQDRLDEAAARIHARIGAPLVTGLGLYADGLEIVQDTIAPAALPDLFPGTALTVTGRWRGSQRGTITVRGSTLDGAAFEQVVEGVPADSPASTALWARALLRDLEDSYACLPTGSGAELARLERQITSTSVRFGVLCRFTAFVAVDTRVVTKGGVPHKVTQPVELPAGWDSHAWTAVSQSAGDAAATSAMVRVPNPPVAFRAGRPARGPAPLVGRPMPTGFAARLPATAPGQASRPPVIPDWVCAQVTDELAGLDAVAGATAAELARHLADLATRLDALIAWLAGAGLPQRRLSALRELVGRLRACERAAARPVPDLAWLREHAATILTEVLDGWQGHDAERLPGGSSRHDPRRTFWKRHG